MYKLIESFFSQIEEALRIASQNINTINTEGIKNIVVSGLGGSGIGGTIVSKLFSNNLPVPVTINKSYTIPAFVDEHTLFIVSSYSGNTEETLSATRMAKEKKANIVVISSGGKISELAKENNYPQFTVPGGNPPRACLSYSMTILIAIFEKMAKTNKFTANLPEICQSELSRQTQTQALAKQLAENIGNKLVVIYAADAFEGLAVRFRQQINENAKQLAWHHVIPEMNHNELVGWADAHKDIIVIYLKNQSIFVRNARRMEITHQVTKPLASHTIEIPLQGQSNLEQLIYGIHLTDWISYYLSEIRKKDVMEVKIIDYLKSELAKI